KPSSHSLFLIQDEIFYDQLVAEGAGAEAVPSLSKLMPKLNTLEVAIGLMNTSDAMRKVAAIIIDLNTRLVHLKVFCSYLMYKFPSLEESQKDCDAARIQLHNAIKQHLSSLKHLTICYKEKLYCYPTRPSSYSGNLHCEQELLDFPNLSHLNEF